MSRLTVAEVESAIDNHDDWYWDEVEWSARSDEGLSLNINGESYPVKVEEEYTGSEGDWNSETWVVFHVGRQTFKKTGYYQSHYGNDWDGPLTEVKKQLKQIYVWENV